MRVAVRANHGAHILGHSGDLHFFTIWTVANPPSVQVVALFVATLNPITFFFNWNSYSPPCRMCGTQERWKKDDDAATAKPSAYAHDVGCKQAGREGSLGMTIPCNHRNIGSNAFVKRESALGILVLRLCHRKMSSDLACVFNCGNAVFVYPADKISWTKAGSPARSDTRKIQSW